MQTTRRYPRTLQQAFGPYASRELAPMPSRHWLRDVPGEFWFMAACLCILATLVLGMLTGWLA